MFHYENLLDLVNILGGHGIGINSHGCQPNPRNDHLCTQISSKTIAIDKLCTIPPIELLVDFGPNFVFATGGSTLSTIDTTVNVKRGSTSVIWLIFRTPGVG